ncbi:hypothetical protein Hanom_Chr17g01582591 [Helianthus anomalus]
MLQRAASNAYSWWWASHIRTKQSKWLEQSLQGHFVSLIQMFHFLHVGPKSFHRCNFSPLG